MYGLSKDYINRAYHQYPKLDRKEIRTLWHCEFYDYARTGMALYHGEKYWFSEVAQDVQRDGHLFSDFLLLKLTPEQLEEEEYWHRLFQEYVGTHIDYEEGGTRRLSIGEQDPRLRPHELHHIFFDAIKKRTKPDYSTYLVVGWFERDWGRVDEEGIPVIDEDDEG